jgi:hypothetical protein
MAMHEAVGRRDGADPADELRDRMTMEWLAASVSDLPDVEVIRYEPGWWDGQAHDPCLVFRYGAAKARRRVVETGGDTVVVPFARRRASRQLAARRARPEPRLGPPPPRAALDDVVLDADHDAVRCGGSGCGAMLALDATGQCPICGTISG